MRVQKLLTQQTKRKREGIKLGGDKRQERLLRVTDILGLEGLVHKHMAHRR
jgi:hypothetical protein